jgi:hypothetical protein
MGGYAWLVPSPLQRPEKDSSPAVTDCEQGWKRMTLSGG